MFYYLGMAFESEASCPDFGSIQMYFVGTRAQGYMEYGDIKFRKYTLLEEDLNKLNLINNAIAGSIAYALDTGNIYKLQGGSGGWQLSGNESGKNMGFDVAVVEQLPEAGEKGIIYLVPHSHGESDSYDEYIWATIKYEKIGNTDIDLSGYVQKLATAASGQIPKIKSDGGLESSGFTLGKSVPADAVFTDVNTTYTLTQDSNDGHKITFASSDSNVSDTVITIPDNNTTYTLTQDANDGHKITFTPSTGSATTITIPDNDTTYNAATQQAAGLMSSVDKTKLDSITVANLLTTADIVVCTQDEYDQLDLKPALLYFIREDEGGT